MKKIFFVFVFVLSCAFKAQVITLIDSYTKENVNFEQIPTIPEGQIVDNVMFATRSGLYYKRIVTNGIQLRWFSKFSDDEAIEKAVKMASFFKTALYFDNREYKITRQLNFNNLSNFKLIGQPSTKILPANNDRLSSYYFRFQDCSNFSIEGLYFDQNKRNLPTYLKTDYDNTNIDEKRDFNSSIFIKDSFDFELKNNSFYDLYNKSIVIYQCYKRVVVRDNYFHSGIQQQNQRMEFLSLWQSHYANILVENNVFDDSPNASNNSVCGIFGFSCGNNGKLTIRNNIFNYCGRSNNGTHRLFAIDFYDDVNNFYIENNRFNNSTFGVIRFDGFSNNGNIVSNYIESLYPSDTGLLDSSAHYWIGDVSKINILNNHFIAKNSTAHGIFIQNIYNNINYGVVNIMGNIFDGFKRGMLLYGNIYNFNITSNTFENLSGTGIEYFTTVLNPDIGDKTKVGDFNISSNIIKCLKSSGCTGIQIGARDDLNNKTNIFNINQNTMIGNSGNFGVVVSSGTNLNNKVLVKENFIQGFSTALFLRNNKTLIKNNVFNQNTNNMLEDSTDNIKENNTTY